MLETDAEFAARLEMLAAEEWNRDFEPDDDDDDDDDDDEDEVEP